VRGQLLDWYAEHGRDLPWRRTRDPYAILVSEVMLQQTQVPRVVPQYLTWLERWPTAEMLAAAPRSEVIRAWQGLGYNRRAVNLHRAAQTVAASGWPDDLIELPGVGPTRPRPWRASPSAGTSCRRTRTFGVSASAPGSPSTRAARRR
jgi:A/G-specific adenine glycosylase